jgi:DnaJ-class molecular chaperone
LSNPEKRQLYDDYGEEGVKNGGPPGGGGFGGFSDLFNFGSKKQAGPRKGKAKLIELEVTLDDIFNGSMKTVKITRYFTTNLEIVFVSPATVKEERM